MQKKSFVLHLDSLSIIEKMTLEQKGILLNAIYHYQIHGKLPELDFAMEMAITPFINQFKRDAEKYLKVVERNKDNGSKGGRPKNPKKPKETQKTQSVISKPKKADNDSDSVNVNDSVNDLFNHKKCTEESFRDELIPYVAKYGKEMIRAFYNYWTEKDMKGKMRINDQQYFDIAKRLIQWSSRDFNGNKKSHANSILSENPNSEELNQIMAQYEITMPDHIANKHWDTRVDYVRRILAVKTKGNVSNFD